MEREAYKTHSPNLVSAMEEIHEVLVRRDIAGHIILHEPGFAEYMVKIDPSWSALRFEFDDEGNTLGIRFQATASDFNNDKEAQKKCVESTINLISLLGTALKSGAGNMTKLYEIAAKEFDIVESKTTHSETPAKRGPGKVH